MDLSPAFRRLSLLALFAFPILSSAPALALNVTAFDSSAKPLRCSEEHPGLCDFMFESALSAADLKKLLKGSQVKMSYSDLQVYAAKHIKGLKSVHLGSRTLWTIRLQGSWLVGDAMRREILSNQTTLAMTGAKGSAANNAAIASSKRSHGNRYHLASAPARDRDLRDQRDQDDGLNEAAAAAEVPSYQNASPDQGRGASAPRNTADRPKMVASAGDVTAEKHSSPSTFSRFEAWATGKDDPNTRIASLIVKGGAPLSPTGMEGAALEFMPEPIIPIRISGGTYDSQQLFKSSKGSVSYSNVAVGTGLLIGRRNGQLDLGLDYVRISAKIKPGADDADAPGSIISQSNSTTYSGIVPHLGLRFVSDSENILSFEFGDFFARDNKAAFQDQGAPLSSTGALGSFHNRPQTFNIGIGTYL